MTEAGIAIDEGAEGYERERIESDLVAARKLLALAVSALQLTGTHTGTITVIQDWLEETKS